VEAGAISWAEPGVIVKETEEAMLSYIDAIPLGSDDVGVATIFVSHPWGGSFDALVKTCSRFPTEIFWIDIFCKNQWIVNSDDTADELQRCIRSAKNGAGQPHVLFVVHPWPAPLALRRIWCLFELMHALLCEAQIHMSMSPEAQASLLAQTRKSQLDALAGAVSLDKAEASVASDISLIMADIRKMPGGKREMEQKLKKYLEDCLWVYIHPPGGIRAQALRHELEPEPEPEPDPEPEPEPEQLVHNANVARMRQWCSNIETHHAWARALVARVEQSEAMTEEEQDEGTRRAFDLLAIRGTLMLASANASDEVIRQLADALREFDELGLVDCDSSQESYDWGGGSDSDE
jgi:hypothetical protein